jgi:hypothetical protein
MRKGIFVSLPLVVITTSIVATIPTSAFLPSWASWAEHLPPQIQQYITRDSEVVDWIYSPENGPTWPLSNWVKAAAYIIYYAPMEHVTPTPQRVVQAAEGSNLVLPHKPSGIPDWGKVKWGTISESRFAQAVEHDHLNNGGVQVTNVFKAAVRIAYWVASFIPECEFGTPINVPAKNGGYKRLVLGGTHEGTVLFTQFTPLEVLENPDKSWPFGGRGWNCAAHAALAVALMRAAMIPAMMVAGYAFDPVMEKVAGHAWVAFYNTSGKWVYVDPTGDAGQWYAETGLVRFLPIPKNGLRNPVEYRDLIDVEYITSHYPQPYINAPYYINNSFTSVKSIESAWQGNIKLNNNTSGNNTMFSPMYLFTLASILIPVIARRRQ